jgi:hypothetical protein
MKNELDSIYERSREIVHELMGGIPLSLYDAEMEALDKLSNELLISMGCDIAHNSKEIKKGYTNSSVKPSEN